MATIEPRLIHLLNQSQSPHLSHSSLPPLQDLPYHNNPARPLPLEPDAGHGQRSGDGSGPGLGLSAKQSFAPGIFRSHDDALSFPASAPSSAMVSGSVNKLLRRDEPSYPVPERPNSLRMILDSDVDYYETSTLSHPLRNLRDDFLDSSEDLSSKKRHHGLTGKEDFPQLPHPLKKQKSSNAVHMPPIIQGLHEPPPNAALFPPISSSAFRDPDSLKLTLLRDFPPRSEDASAMLSPIALPDSEERSPATALTTSAPSPGPSGAAGGNPTSPAKTKRRAPKPRRKWTEEETKHLLLGVHKHGVGRWTDILEDPGFQFNDRTAGDLKDRFRTCCPDELRSKKDKEKDKSPSSTIAPETRSKPPPGPLQIESILEPEESNKPESPSEMGQIARPRKSRAHRKNMEDLAELGIHGPFKKSHRRERKPFSDQDDREILRGFETYGPQWTKIQRDPNFHLSNRQATDLRDRLRNKRPDLFGSSAKSQHVKDAGKCAMSVELSLNRQLTNAPATSLSHSNSREDMPKWPYPSADSGPSSAAQDWAESTHVLTQPPSLSSLTNDMGISRLLLDDSGERRAEARL